MIGTEHRLDFFNISAAARRSSKLWCWGISTLFCGNREKNITGNQAYTRFYLNGITTWFSKQLQKLEWKINATFSLRLWVSWFYNSVIRLTSTESSSALSVDRFIVKLCMQQKLKYLITILQTDLITCFGLIASGIWALRFIFSINDDYIKAIQVLSSWNSFPRGRESDHNVKLANRTFENVFNQISDCLCTQENKNIPELWNFLESYSFSAEVAACQ